MKRKFASLATSVVLVAALIGLIMPVQGRFVTIESVHVDYDRVYNTEYMESESKVTIEVVLTNFSAGIAGHESELRFSSDFAMLQSIIVDGTPQAYTVPFVVDHSTVKMVRVTLDGNAPKVTTRTDDVLLLSITQKVVDEYQVVEIRRTVSSEAIEDAIAAIADARAELERADAVIEAAKARGLEVSEALSALELAKEHLNNSQQLYITGLPEAALAEAQQAKAKTEEVEIKLALELLLITSPPTPASAPTDSDGDGWSDDQERTAGTSPYNVDTDGDGMWDAQDPNPLVAAIPTPTRQPLIPGFEVIFAIIGLLTLAFFVLRREK